MRFSYASDASAPTQYSKPTHNLAYMYVNLRQTLIKSVTPNYNEYGYEMFYNFSA